MATGRVGIIGGGQLARMLALAGAPLGIACHVVERHAHSPAAQVTSHSLTGDWNDPEVLLTLARNVDVLTLESEFVEVDSLAQVAQAGFSVWPRPQTLRLIQDKYTQKQFLAEAGLPVPPFEAVDSTEEVVQAGERLGWPLVLKARRNAYDGKGNATIHAADQVAAAWTQLGGAAGQLYVEGWCAFEKELAVIITRGLHGELAVYPVVESIQADHICREVLAPAPVSTEIARQAAQIAAQAITAIDGVGSMGVEMFLTKDGQVLINELAPRVHNTGHYSIEGCGTSQFENHLRAILGWPLGSTGMVRPAAVMVNLLGEGTATGRPAGLQEALTVPGAHIHLYGKAESRPGRKMGHVTALGDTLEAAQKLAWQAARQIGFGRES